jgi:outer membrane protein assembly factor BamB
VIRNLLKHARILLAAMLMVVLVARIANGYVEVFYPLGKVLLESTNVLVMVVESVDKQKNTIIYKKVRDLKGTHPGETIKHNIAQAGFEPREWQNVMAWAEVGKTAIFFHNGGAGETCIDNYWYQTPAGGEWWSMSHAEPFMLRTYCGKAEKLANFIAAMQNNQEVVVPCMVDGDKEALKKRVAKMQRLKASLKIQDWNPTRDFVDFGAGGDEMRPVAGMPGFTHILALTKVGPGATGVTPADINGDGRADLAVYGAEHLNVLLNGGNAFDEVRLPVQVGARAAAWADYDGDKRADLFVATPTGPRLFRNTTEKAAQFEDVTAGLPRQSYFHTTAAAWLDYNGDGRPDLLIADGFRGLRLYKNLGPSNAPPPQKSITGKWFFAGPFDSTGGKGFDAVYPPEQGVDLKAQYTGKNNEKFGWKEAPFADGQVNSFMPLLKPELAGDAAVYVYREFNVAGEFQTPVSLGSDDTLTVWFNGAKVHAENTSRGAAPDQAILNLKFKPGKNTLLMKICNGSGEFGYYYNAKLPEVTTQVPPLFEDVSDSVGLGENGIGAAQKGDRIIVADVDGDGRQDFLFCAGSGILVLNTQKGFIEAKNTGISFKSGGVTPVFGDFNGDGKPDLFIPQSGVSKLLKNDGTGKFTDVTAQSGDLSRSLGDARCAAFVEFKKGRNDLLIGCWKGANRYLRNKGNGTFVDRTEDIGLAYRMFNTSALSVQDLNKDGTPDVVFNNEGQEPVLLLANPEFFNEPVVLAAAGSSQVAGVNADGTTSATGGTSSKNGGLMILVVMGVVAGIFLVLMRRGSNMSLFVLALLAGILAASSSHAADWPEARGNSQRTGNIDNQQGPKAPNVLWVHKASEHYITSPVPTDKALFVPVMGALNTGSFHALNIAPGAAERIMWTKTAPYITHPTVCAPAVADGYVVFGDGMHQTDDATLYCLQADTGMPVWRYPVPGKLMHLEAGPIIDKGRVYACGGDAGIFCVDMKKVTLEGKEQDLGAVVPILNKKWADMNAKYEAEKKKDPLLAIPPSEDALPKAQPKLIWQQGKNKWHVDAPPVIAGEFILVSSAYLDDEKEGQRSVFCLKASDGSIVWEAPLTYNPWSGATVSGDTVLVGCSSIRFDRKLIGKAKGEVVALNLADGKVKWRKPLEAAAVLSPIAVKGDIAIYTCTDGNVIARTVAAGERKWTYDAKQPFFAGAAIAGEGVYLADLFGNVHALNLADGVLQWKFDLAGNEQIQAKSMIFGSPTVHGGDLYIASCNPDGETQQSSYVVCLSDKPPGLGAGKSTPVTVNAEKRQISIPCKIAPRKLASLKEVYPLEVLATYASPRGQKAHETVVTFDTRPSDVHKALEQIGCKPGKPVVGEGVMASGAELKIFLEVPGVTGGTRLIPAEKLMVDMRTGKSLPPMVWHFTGSVMKKPDPTKDETVYGADLTGTLVSLLPVTDETVCQAHVNLAEGKLLRLDTNKDLLPPEGTEIKLIMQAIK